MLAPRKEIRRMKKKILSALDILAAIGEIANLVRGFVSDKDTKADDGLDENQG